MTKLTKTITTIENDVESRLIISVDYNKNTGAIDIDNVRAESQSFWRDGNIFYYAGIFSSVEMTQIFEDSPTLRAFIYEQNWEEVFEETKYQQEG